jgi:hypothetical protein
MVTVGPNMDWATRLAPVPTCTLPVTVTFCSVQLAPAGTTRLPLIVPLLVGGQVVSAARAAGTVPARIPRAASGVIAKCFIKRFMLSSDLDLVWFDGLSRPAEDVSFE